jgi:GGDEF domain-containing protein
MVREVARHARAMEQLAHRDARTGLWNRRTCDDRQVVLTEDDSRNTILMLDVPSTTIQRALEVAQRIRATTARTLRDPPVTVGIGVAEVSGSSLTSRLGPIARSTPLMPIEPGRNQIAATQE